MKTRINIQSKSYRYCEASIGVIVARVKSSQALLLGFIFWFSSHTPFAAAAESTAPGGVTTLRVLSYNIHHGEGTDGILNLDRIAEIIKSAASDIVTLQEVDKQTRRSNGIDQANRLGELTGLHSVFGKALDYQDGFYGIAILSRWPLKTPKTHALPAKSGVEPRIVLESTVSLGNGEGDIRILVTHLDHKKNPVDRMEQTAEIERLFPTTENEAPAILAGDLNATPDSDVIKRLLALWSDSATHENLLTIPAATPRRKIDYILYRPSKRWRVVDSRVLEESVASDHRPLLSVLELLP